MSRSWTRLEPTQYRRMPWKNGGGTTDEIAVHPPQGASRFVWRLSIATIERDGPFSDFAGYRRTIMAIEGKGMILDFGSHGVERLDRLFEPIDFRGEWSAECRLIDGPCRDFNIMVDRERCGVAARVVRVPASADPTATREGAPLLPVGSQPEAVTVVSSGMTTLLFVLQGEVRAEAPPWLPATTLPRHAALRIDAAKDDDSPLPIGLSSVGDAAVVYQIDLRWT